MNLLFSSRNPLLPSGIICIMRFTSSSKYVKLPTAEEDKSPPARYGRNTSIFILSVCASFIAGALGFLATRQLTSVVSHNHTFQLDESIHTFHYNRSFSYPPSNRTNRAWRDIFPAEGGFFVHPIVAPTRSTFSVFHQLHCLNAIRGGYWASHRAAIRGEKLVDAALPVDIQESHIRHCTDLIRQSLMCMADTTLEVIDEKINGVHGFRTEHVCRDWNQLKEWVSLQQKKTHVEQIV
ncbi:unnamed protein product [Periconia digitata]|uniref:Uncharacterized protein n=1 Tax=Periconia digitata TaxID=1303443 RepID=A0A9W4UCA4_9PLEO|nr:unnamed protein product [Periconia digitata]